MEMDKKQFMELMLATSIKLRKWAPDFSDQMTLRAWYQELSHLPIEKLAEACHLAVQTMDEFPSVAKLIRITKGTTLSDEEIGQDVACRIESALSKFGWPNPKGAEEYIGQIGWEVVRQLGGWVSVCEVMDNEMMSARKQWRELAAIVSKKFHTLGENKGPALPEGAKVDRPPALQAAMDLITTRPTELS